MTELSAMAAPATQGGSCQCSGGYSAPCGHREGREVKSGCAAGEEPADAARLKRNAGVLQIGPPGAVDWREL